MQYAYLYGISGVQQFLHQASDAVILPSFPYQVGQQGQDLLEDVQHSVQLLLVRLVCCKPSIWEITQILEKPTANNNGNVVADNCGGEKSV